jgi:DNA-binding response OmpR family regulator
MVAPDIFFVEDNEDFTFLMEHAVQKVDNNLKIRIVSNGKEALGLILQLKEAKSRPGVILLDQNLPGLSGLDLLKQIKEIPFFTTVPVIIFSSSDNPRDLRIALEFGAADFITKPMGYINLLACVRLLNESWLNNKPVTN